MWPVSPGIFMIGFNWLIDYCLMSVFQNETNSIYIKTIPIYILEIIKGTAVFMSFYTTCEGLQYILPVVDQWQSTF